MNVLAAGLGFIDLRFLGRARVIATAVLHGPAGVALLDPGPASCLPVLHQVLAQHGIGIRDVRAILLTHVHLDHAGATGRLVRANPGLVVHVHERGAPHLADPSRLLASAARLYGGEMQRLWGDVLPVPSSAIRPIGDAARLEAAGRTLEAVYTPGHAAHHVSYFDGASGVAFVGDTAGIRILDTPYVAPATPPPDVDLEAWEGSVRRIESLHPDTLFVTHFGPVQRPAHHFRAMWQALDEASRLVRASLADGDEAGCTDEDRAERFAAAWSRRLRRFMPEPEAVLYEAASPPGLCWLGLARYWRRRGGS
jgi:glyoxylase-like metal-dependent hydrolase (beta-lactamase superfamily II)